MSKDSGIDTSNIKATSVPFVRVFITPSCPNTPCKKFIVISILRFLFPVNSLCFYEGIEAKNLLTTMGLFAILYALVNMTPHISPTTLPEEALPQILDTEIVAPSHHEKLANLRAVKLNPNQASLPDIPPISAANPQDFDISSLESAFAAPDFTPPLSDTLLVQKPLTPVYPSLTDVVPPAPQPVENILPQESSFSFPSDFTPIAPSYVSQDNVAVQNTPNTFPTQTAEITPPQHVTPPPALPPVVQTLPIQLAPITPQAENNVDTQNTIKPFTHKTKEVKPVTPEDQLAQEAAKLKSSKNGGVSGLSDLEGMLFAK
jgi:hypothetical protein